VNSYNVALFVHVLGVVALFVAIGMQQWGGAQLRGAATLEHLRLWLRLVVRSQSLYGPAIAVLLLGGLFMAGKAWSFTAPWIVVALVGLAAMIGLGILVVGRRFAAIEAAAKATGEGHVPADVARLIARPGVWACMSALNGIAVGILWLMTNKPEWAASIAVVVVAAAAAGIAGGMTARPKGRRAVEPLADGRQ
jgi:hypothetical protein